METENITCDICKEVKWTFIDVETQKNSFMSKRFQVCIDCFKNKDIEEILSTELRKQAQDEIKFHQAKIDEVKLRLRETNSASNSHTGKPKEVFLSPPNPSIATSSVGVLDKPEETGTIQSKHKRR